MSLAIRLIVLDGCWPIVSAREGFHLLVLAGISLGPKLANKPQRQHKCLRLECGHVYFNAQPTISSIITPPVQYACITPWLTCYICSIVKYYFTTILS